MTRWSACGLLAGLGTIPALPGPPGNAALTDRPDSPCAAPFTASAASDLLILRRRDTQPAQRAPEQPPDLLGTATRAGFYGGAEPLTAARAGVFAPGGAKPTHVLQVAPPTQTMTVTASLAEADDGRIRVGARDLRARAVLSKESGCDDALAESTAKVRTDSVVTGPGGQTVRMPAGARTHTATGLVAGSGGYSTLALATATVPDLEVLGGTTVRVTTGPSLRVSASGDPNTSTIDFTAPMISISSPEAPTTFRDLTGPVDFPVTDDPDQIATVLSLLRALGGDGLDEAPTGGADRALVVRLAPGGMVEQNRGWVVHGLASALRVTVLVREMAGAETLAETELAEIGVGCVEALAFAPVGGYPRNEDSPQPVGSEETPGSGARSSAEHQGTGIVPAGGAPLEPASTLTSPDTTNPDTTRSTAAAARPTLSPVSGPPSPGHTMTMNSAPGRTSLTGCLLALAIGACGLYGLWRRRMGGMRP